MSRARESRRQDRESRRQDRPPRSKLPDLLHSLRSPEAGNLRRKRQPVWEEPMLATLTHNFFSDKEWIYERKFDGERCLAFKRDRNVRLLTRNRKPANSSYPEIVQFLEKQEAAHYIIDGEVVAFQGNQTSFSRLQQRMHASSAKAALASGIPVFFYVFDLLYVDGYDVTGLALTKRKSLLRSLLDYQDPVRFTVHRRREGEAYHREACRKGWEGVIAKRSSCPYRHSRSSDWLKFKCVNEQEFVIGGYTDPQGARSHFGALLIGYYEDSKLRYAGKVGTGYNEQTLSSIGGMLEDLRQSRKPFADPVPGKVHWVKPRLVAEIGFTEWTRDGRLRHPRFLGLRRDKKAKQVIREGPSK